MNDQPQTVVLGVDTHLNIHVGAVVDHAGRPLGTLAIPTTPEGYQRLLAWAQSLGQLERAGVEGTGSYGAGLARFLTSAGVHVIDVNRPDRSRRRRLGKNDPVDAENAARAVLAGQATGTAKTKTGVVEALRAVSVVRRSAVKARTQAGNQLRSLLVTAPDDVRAELLPMRLSACVARCARWRLPGEPSSASTLRCALQLIAKRWLGLSEEIEALDASLAHLTALAAPRVRASFGVGPHTAATLLLTAGDNPQRLRSEAALAALCGVSPLEASSGKVVRHRLNRGGDRQANNALWTIALIRMRSDPRTKTYVHRRTEEGRTPQEIRRILKRYIVRELYPLLLADLQDASVA